MQVCGFGEKSFFKAIENIREAHLKFERIFPPGTLEPWQYSKFEGDAAIDLANRYFERVRESEGDEAVDFAYGVDPNDILRGMAIKENLQHTIDNRVLYYEMKGGDEEKRYTAHLSGCT